MVTPTGCFAIDGPMASSRMNIVRFIPSCIRMLDETYPILGTEGRVNTRQVKASDFLMIPLVLCIRPVEEQPLDLKMIRLNIWPTALILPNEQCVSEYG